MALTANREVDHYVDQELRSYGVAGGEKIFKGALVEFGDDGYLRALSGGGRFGGLAYEEADNGGGSDGDVAVRVYTVGDFGFELSGAGVGDVGRAVYAVDDETLSFGAAGGTFVGYVQQVVSAEKVIVRLDEVGPVGVARLEHCGSSFSVGVGQSGATFTNLGAAGAIVAALPQSAPVGTEYRFVCMADQELRVAPGAGGGIYVKGAKQADDKYVAIGDIGDFLHLVADGNGDWVAVASIGGADGDISVEA